MGLMFLILSRGIDQVSYNYKRRLIDIHANIFRFHYMT